MRVVRFYVSSTPHLPPPPSSSSFLLRPPDLNCKLVIAVFPARPKQQAQDQIVPPRAVFPAEPAQRFRIRVFPAGPQLQVQDRSIPAGPEKSRKICQRECKRECQNTPMSGRMPNRTSKKMLYNMILHVSGCFLADVAW